MLKKYLKTPCGYTGSSAGSLEHCANACNGWHHRCIQRQTSVRCCIRTVSYVRVHVRTVVYALLLRPITWDRKSWLWCERRPLFCVCGVTRCLYVRTLTNCRSALMQPLHRYRRRVLSYIARHWQMRLVIVSAACGISLSKSSRAICIYCTSRHYMP